MGRQILVTAADFKSENMKLKATKPAATSQIPPAKQQNSPKKGPKKSKSSRIAFFSGGSVFCCFCCFLEKHRDVF